MAERSISERDVQSVLDSPTSVEPGARPDTIAVSGYCAGGRTVKVVVDAADNERVITVMLVRT